MVRVGIAGVVHVHAPSYARCLEQSGGAELSGVWDPDADAAARFAGEHGCAAFDSLEELTTDCDAMVAAGTNIGHASIIEAVLAAGKPVLCEKPLAASAEETSRIAAADAQAPGLLGTAFPCPFSPVFHRMVEMVRSGEIGRVLSVSATNRGKCPGGWFVKKEESGGGAMIDHTVHVADLLWRLLGERPTSVSAETGDRLLGLDVEDTAHLTLGFPSGVFATLDSSWSRPKDYPVWGDVNLSIVGEHGTCDVELFGQGLRVYQGGAAHIGTGSDLDAAMVAEFVASVKERKPFRISGEDGICASRVALAAYESAATGLTANLG
ncbi:MAG: Gfo/Idh/MocA family oxidoreductase [Fimbriimonadaceae bacterium]|nr:Gfo/Idh/MocA family oxidoreductase [Fimbriimonadaceae bacterium]